MTDVSASRPAPRRATPADPLPGVTVDRSMPASGSRNMPPELGPDAIAILEGRTFIYSDSVGDVPGGSIGGLVHADTRFLSRWVLTINGVRLLTLRAGVVDHYSAEFFLTNPPLPGTGGDGPPLSANTIGVRRLRFVGDGLHERIELQSFAREPVRLEVRLSVGNDFADLFEIKAEVRDRSAQIERDHAADGSRLLFRYRNGRFHAQTAVEADPHATRLEGDDLVWQLELAAGERWEVTLTVPLRLGPREIQPMHRDFGDVFAPDGKPDPLLAWVADMPWLETDSDLVRQVMRKTRQDLVALRMEARLGDEEIVLPAAGLPWFLTLFGRDTLITAYQTVAVGPWLAEGAVLALAQFQGTRVDDFRDEEPGKILHELRQGELTVLGLKPHDPYYGTADATMLWLILLSECWRWTSDDELVRSLRAQVLAALEWIDRYGDRDGDGYVEYGTRSPQGLGNQCWRDSWNGIQFADGSLPVLPIATCELQGYAYDAKLRSAELADGPLADPTLAARLRAEAGSLRERFDRDFWIEERGGYYAVGLDGDKRRIDSMTSNMGQLLWSGIVPRERAPAIARQLGSEALFSGWGVRTLSTGDSGFNPIGYHTGTVWPHDNSLIAAGLAAYGFRDEANRIALALLDAAGFCDFRLPEAFSGYPRSVGRFPVPYPTACSPQAWATGAPLLLLRAMAGLEARGGELTLDPHLPPDIGRLTIHGLRAFGQRWNVEASGGKGSIRPAD